jgi:uncharacterized protein with von Willebrand factor type A (vWA) domain
MTDTPANGDYFTPPSAPLRPLEIERGERLLFRLVEFGRILWEVGIDVGPGKMLDLAETLNYIDLTSKEDFYHTLKCSLLGKHEQETLFDQMYLYYWSMRDRQRRGNDTVSGAAGRDEKQLRLPPSEMKRLAEHMNTPADIRRDLRSQMRESERRSNVMERDTREEEEKGEQEENPQGTAYSAIEALRKKDFETFSWDEVEEAKKLMAQMRWHLGMRQTHRKVSARRGTSPDMRKIVRRNLKYGAELLELTWRQTRQKPRPLVIICDISGSMSLYSRLLLHFVHTISNGLLNVEAFVFGTRLTRITRQLKRRDVDDAVRDVSKTVQDWSGGTRIGDALHSFNHQWARRVLGRGAVVLVISDGWDRGDAGTLAVEMDRLQHSSHRLIWLNPLLGSPEYRPLTIGMKTALPYIDNFLPVHNLDSLINLGNLLNSIDESRPERSPGARKRAVEAWGNRSAQ